MILEQAAFHLHQLVLLYKQHKLLTQRLVAYQQTLASEIASGISAQLGSAEQTLLEVFAYFGPQVEEFLHSVKDYEFCAAYAQNHLFRSRPVLPVSLQFSYNRYVPGSVHAHGDVRAEAEFETKLFVCEQSVGQILAAAERSLPPDPSVVARQAAIRLQGLRKFIAEADPTNTLGLAFRN